MAGGCCFLNVSEVLPLLLLVLYHHDIQASTCPRPIHKREGDSVELPTCLTTEGVTEAKWAFGRNTLVDKREGPYKYVQFEGRIYMNPTNYSLTVSNLTLRDSGNFSFMSETKDTQRRLITFPLHIHEILSVTPVLSFNITWHALNGSCTVFLECNAKSYSSVAYNWTVKNQNHVGSTLQYTLSPKEGSTMFTCTISNYFSQQSASETVTCTNASIAIPKTGSTNLVLILGAAGGIFMIIIIATVMVAVRSCIQKQAGSNQNELALYAEISEATIQDSNVQNVQGKANSNTAHHAVYAATDNVANPVHHVVGPQTVYDEIQFNRTAKSSTALH
ncbi:signaling lymphocytic activation molecule-like [Thalassophryne amazonica]|uniref:signaling lymphocytic activation molecule-like n=1 Tax=Thalassophryne amazonica TaxID=390379 RepID=UPI0014709BBF|nr:signaling lymphocytic activation molecule-like [Thalassophryne amazonica]